MQGQRDPYSSVLHMCEDKAPLPFSEAALHTVTSTPRHSNMCLALRVRIDPRLAGAGIHIEHRAPD